MSPQFLKFLTQCSGDPPGSGGRRLMPPRCSGSWNAPIFFHGADASSAWHSCQSTILLHAKP
eukprot:3133969-Lingulodinium_polyedra.AAC.1